MDDSLAARVGRRLRTARVDRTPALTLAELSRSSGVSASTISRLESGKRQPNLELLVPLAAALEISIDELVSDAVPDPRVHRRTSYGRGREAEQLSNEHSPMQTVRMTITPTGEVPELRTHEGFEWLYVMSGRLRLMLGEHDLVLREGEAAEFATRIPHYVGAAGEEPVELMAIFSRDGERIHVRAQTEPDRRAGR